jgi:hypothetical protein
MGSRISTIQRQARELGRLRTGTFNPEAGKGKGAPQRSKTWIVTSPYENQVEAAAELWGGTPEKWQPQGNGAPQMRVITDAAVIEAILPPGDPVDQSYETWSKGGVQRRCNGTSEAISGQPCICRATWGDEFYEVAKDDACKMTTRLNVILPQMPDMGVFRVETHSFYSANEIAASVDIIRAAVGENRLVPVNLRIEPRTRVAQGKTKHFPVIVVEIRGVTSGELLAATMAAKGELGGARAAIEAARPDYLALAQDATTAAEVTAIWNQALAAGHLDDELKAKLSPIGIALRAAEQKSAQEAAEEQPAAEEVAEACAHEAEYDPDCKGCRAHQAAEDRRLAAES